MNSCSFHGSARGCRFGRTCYFSHDHPETIPLCAQYQAQSCRFGNRCKFRHISFNQDYNQESNGYAKAKTQLNFYKRRETSPSTSINIGDTGYCLLNKSDTHTPPFKPWPHLQFSGYCYYVDYIHGYSHVCINGYTVQLDYDSDLRHNEIGDTVCDGIEKQRCFATNNNEDIFMQIWYHTEQDQDHQHMKSKIFHHKLVNKEKKVYDIIKADTVSINFEKQVFSDDSPIKSVQSECIAAGLIGSMNDKYLLSYCIIFYEPYYSQIYYNIYTIIDTDNYKLQLLSYNVKDFTTLNELYYLQLLDFNKSLFWICNEKDNFLMYCFQAPPQQILSQFHDKHRETRLYMLRSKYFCTKTRNILNEYTYSNLIDLLMSFVADPLDIFNAYEYPVHIDIKQSFETHDQLYVEQNTNLLYIWCEGDICRRYELKQL